MICNNFGIREEERICGILQRGFVFLVICVLFGGKGSLAFCGEFECFLIVLMNFGKF
jgi:hypothetical protein